MGFQTFRWGGGHPDSEIRGGGEGGLQKIFFGPFGPHFGIKIRKGGGGGKAGPPGPSSGSATAL